MSEAKHTPGPWKVFYTTSGQTIIGIGEASSAVARLIEEYRNLVKTGAEYAASELRLAPTSVFEIYIGHFRDIGRDIEAALLASPAVAPVAVSGDNIGLQPVRLIEMVNYDKGYPEPAEPMWRVEVSGYCADFEAQLAANNFHHAISSIIPATKGGEALSINALADVINRARYVPGGLPERGIDEEDQGSRDYAFRLARAVSAALAQDTDAAPPVAPTGTAGISDAMVERALAVWFETNEPWYGGMANDVIDGCSKQMRAALEAALSAPTVEGEGP